MNGKRHGSIGAVAVSVLLLAGCVSEPEYPPEMSDSEAEAVMQRQADDHWAYIENRFPDAERPSTASVVFHDGETYWEAFTDCVEEAGVEESLAGDMSSLPVEEQEAIELAQGLCAIQHRLDPREAGMLGSEQLEFLYDHFTMTTAPCLRLLGYEVREPPGKEVFISQNGWTWNPYEFAPGGSPLIEFRCPRLTEPPFADYFPS